MDAIDNRVTSGSNVGATNGHDLAHASAEAKRDFDSQIAEKEIKEFQQQHLQQRVHEASLPLAETDQATEWDPWKIMVIRHQ